MVGHGEWRALPNPAKDNEVQPASSEKQPSTLPLFALETLVAQAKHTLRLAESYHDHEEIHTLGDILTMLGDMQRTALLEQIRRLKGER
jgi:hypothetical protein